MCLHLLGDVFIYCYMHTLVDCGSLENPTNGQVDFTATFGGSIANYTCNQGYLLCGAESRICQSNGSWSGSPPDCISKLYMSVCSSALCGKTHYRIIFRGNCDSGQ